jgi:hypothetical protein
MSPDIAQQIIDTLHARIDDLMAERDRLLYEVGAIPAIKAERDALMAAGKLALDFVEWVWRDVTLNEFGEDMRLNVEIALRQAGVQ